MEDDVDLCSSYQDTRTTSSCSTAISQSWRQSNSYDPRECGVCNEEFDEDLKCPRTLRCSHNLCTSCINKLITNNTRKCPYCRRNFRASAASDIMINQGILDFIKYFSHQEGTTEEVVKSKGTPGKKKIDDYKEDIVKTTNDLLFVCQDEKNHIEASVRDIRRLRDNLKQENILINEEILPKIHNIAKRNFSNMEYLQVAEKKLQNQLEELKLKEKQLCEEKVKLDDVKSFREIMSILDESENTNNVIGAWADNSRARITENRIYIQSVEKNVQASKEQVQILRDTLSYQDDEEDEESDSFPVCVI